MLSKFRFCFFLFSSHLFLIRSISTWSPNRIESCWGFFFLSSKMLNDMQICGYERGKICWVPLLNVVYVAVHNFIYDPIEFIMWKKKKNFWNFETRHAHTHTQTHESSFFVYQIIEVINGCTKQCSNWTADDVKLHLSKQTNKFNKHTISTEDAKQSNISRTTFMKQSLNLY